MSNKEIYKKLSLNRYGKDYDNLDDTEKFMIELDMDRLNY